MSSEFQNVAPEQIDKPAGEIRHLILPERDLFSRRAERFRQLAPGHPLGEYLDFLAAVADAQQQALDQIPEVPQPDPRWSASCHSHGIPLLNVHSWQRHSAWQQGLALLLQQVSSDALPGATRKSISSLQEKSEAELEQIADLILSGELAKVSPRELPFVAAALQVYWLQMATALGEAAFGRTEHGGTCPVCGSLPSSGIVGSPASEQGLRYLCCSLCAAQWHMVRIKCCSCEATGGINHYILEGANGAVKAESCDNCNSYLKLLYLEKDRQMEAMADDLATLTLDMLMDGEGKSRGGPNLFFHPGTD
ncbi:formate dehydrogenase accessory protein FdhE [Geobacter pelophilus]|uniref:Protein FdhE homolog n=1 Tax=Geoanaerobacter pelophilus TaxID=60036 RepID=A0AAW4KY42_9BACT|nr:formate dehydrogenase accessory protein FdhE [Geoanaerobacter pelophilus]MBT0662822.1 formate dehydrogenase accessory protein FdhE [Geoanaerobacter pelophilus]